MTPADGGPYARAYSLGTASGYTEDWNSYACGFQSGHYNYSSIWMHPVGTGVNGWGPAGYGIGEAQEEGWGLN